jgi:hypothetical protein
MIALPHIRSICATLGLSQFPKFLGPTTPPSSLPTDHIAQLEGAPQQICPAGEVGIMDTVLLRGPEEKPEFKDEVPVYIL